MTDQPTPEQALAEHLECSLDDIETNSYGTYEAMGEEWRVMTEEEADEAWEEALDSYLDDCVLPELPETAQRYFDREAWKRDARHDGRGHAIGHYDGYDHDSLGYVLVRVN